MILLLEFILPQSLQFLLIYCKLMVSQTQILPKLLDPSTVYMYIN